MTLTAATLVRSANGDAAWALAHDEVFGTEMVGGVTTTEDFTGADGAAWPAQWTTGYTGPGAAATIQTNRGRLASGTQGGYSGASRVTRRLTTPAIDVDIAGTWTPDANEPYGFVVARGYGDGDTQHGYMLLLNKSGTLHVERVLDYAGRRIGSVTFAASSGTTYGFRFRVIGDRVQARLWSGAEPSTWDVDVVDTAIPRGGAVGLSNACGNATVSHVIDFDAVTVTDGTAGGGTEFTETVTDDVGAVDALTVALGYGRTLDDSQGLADTLTAAQAMSRALDDTAGTTDTVSAALGIVRAFTDAAGLTDTLAAEVARTVTVNDPVGVADAIVAAVAFGRAITDGAGLTDPLTASLALARSLNDTVGVADALAAEVAIAVALNDPVGLVDVLSSALALARTVTDPVGLLDALTSAVAYARTVDDAEGLADTLASQLGKLVQVDDSAGLVDLVSRVIAYARTQTDPAGLVDPLAVAAAYGRPDTDSAGVTDTVIPALTMGRSLVDVVGLGDDVIAAVTRGRALDDAGGMTDSIVVELIAGDGTRGVITVGVRSAPGHGIGERPAVEIQLSTRGGGPARADRGGVRP